MVRLDANDILLPDAFETLVLLPVRDVLEVVPVEVAELGVHGASPSHPAYGSAVNERLNQPADLHELVGEALHRLSVVEQAVEQDVQRLAVLEYGLPVTIQHGGGVQPEVGGVPALDPLSHASELFELAGDPLDSAMVH
jgi:hypothetical protein